MRLFYYKKVQLIFFYALSKIFKNYSSEHKFSRLEGFKHLETLRLTYVQLSIRVYLKKIG